MSDAPESTGGEAPEAGAPREPAKRRGGGRAWKVAALLVAVFLLGGVTGAFVSRALFLGDLRSAMRGPPGGAMTHLRVEALRRHLDLGDDQVARLRTILDESETAFAEHMARCGPEMQKLRESVDEQIRAILTPEQRDAYQRYTERASWRQRRPPGGGPGGPRSPGGPGPFEP